MSRGRRASARSACALPNEAVSDWFSSCVTADTSSPMPARMFMCASSWSARCPSISMRLLAVTSRCATMAPPSRRPSRRMRRCDDLRSPPIRHSQSRIARLEPGEHVVERLGAGAFRPDVQWAAWGCGHPGSPRCRGMKGFPCRAVAPSCRCTFDHALAREQRDVSGQRGENRAERDSARRRRRRSRAAARPAG